MKAKRKDKSSGALKRAPKRFIERHCGTATAIKEWSDIEKRTIQ